MKPILGLSGTLLRSLVDFFRRSETLHRHVEAVAQRAPQVPGSYREQLMKRLR